MGSTARSLQGEKLRPKWLEVSQINLTTRSRSQSRYKVKYLSELLQRVEASGLADLNQCDLITNLNRNLNQLIFLSKNQVI